MSRQKKKALFALELVLLAVLTPSPALRFGGGVVTPYGICTAAAALLSVTVFERLRLRMIARPKDGPIAVIFHPDVLDLALGCIPAALCGARALYVLLRPGYYLFDVGVLHALCLWEGGFLLWGAVFGTMAAAIGLAEKQKIDPRKLLDQMAAPDWLRLRCAASRSFSQERGLAHGSRILRLPGFPLQYAMRMASGRWQYFFLRRWLRCC